MYGDLPYRATDVVYRMMRSYVSRAGRFMYLEGRVCQLRMWFARDAKATYESSKWRAIAWPIKSLVPFSRPK